MEKLARQHLRGSLVRSESSPKGGICVSRGREPAVGVVSPHPSRVAAAAFHEFVPPLARLRFSTGTEPRAYARG
jgi:hypothetical protein